MTSLEQELVSRATHYAQREGIEISGVLGYGIDGRVFKTSRQSALKVFERDDGYVQERNVYLRFHMKEVTEIRGHSVPQLWMYDDELRIIEMSIVQPPYLLDFAKSRLDEPPDFTDDSLSMWHEDKAEAFEERWEDVQDVMSSLVSQHGVHLYDINPGNITFENDSEGDQSRESIADS